MACTERRKCGPAPDSHYEIGNPLAAEVDAKRHLKEFEYNGERSTSSESESGPSSCFLEAGLLCVRAGQTLLPRRKSISVTDKTRPLRTPGRERDREVLNSFRRIRVYSA